MLLMLLRTTVSKYAVSSFYTVLLYFSHKSKVLIEKTYKTSAKKMYFRHLSVPGMRCLCGITLQKLRLGRACFSTVPVLFNAKHKKSWRLELPYSDILFHYKLEVPVTGMLHLTTACNTFIKSKYNEDEPMKKELEVKIYAKRDQGVEIEHLQRIVDRVHKFRNIVRHKFTGHPPMLRVILL